MSAELHARFALNTYSYTLHGTIGDHLPAFAAAGFRELELMMYPGHLWPLDMGAAEQAALRCTVEGLGLRVRTLNQPNIDINVTAATPHRRPRHHRTCSSWCATQRRSVTTSPTSRPCARRPMARVVPG